MQLRKKKQSTVSSFMIIEAVIDAEIMWALDVITLSTLHQARKICLKMVR